MAIKANFERYYESFFDKIRLVSAQKTRIKQFKNKSSKTALTRDQIQQVKAFYKPYRIPSMVFHRFFTEKTGVFCANYLPQDIYVYVDTYLNDLHAAKHIDNKCYYDLFFYNVPQPHLILKRMNHIWLDSTGTIVDQNTIRELLALEADKYGIFVKEAQVSAGGHGVLYISDPEQAYDMTMQFAKRFKTDIVIQRKLTQHAEFAKFNNSSVNSLRLYSVLHKNGEVKIYSAVLRMGVGDSKVDNFASGGVSCGIRTDGTLHKYAYNKKGERVTAHPSSGVVFEGYQLPSWDAAVALVKRTHPTIAHFRSVSWDIAITENGEPVLIEANLCRGGVDLLQMCNGPLYGEDTTMILDEVFGKK